MCSVLPQPAAALIVHFAELLVLHLCLNEAYAKIVKHCF